VIEKLYSYFSIHSTKPSGVYLYGSTSRNEHTKDSDVDVFLLYKPLPRNWRPGKYLKDGRVALTSSSLKAINDDLTKMFGRKVDVRCYTFKDKEVFIPEGSEWFAECVQTDALPVYQNFKGNSEKNYLKTCFFTIIKK
jgi:predicted nucleotidyltransferase